MLIQRSVSVLLLQFLLLSGCGNCSSKPPRQAKSPTVVNKSSSPHSSGNSPASDASATSPSHKDTFPPQIDNEPLSTSLFLSAGKVDFENSYPATVMITTGAVREGGRCSGILIAPRVVLTAGSCVCVPGRALTPGDKDKTLIAASACAERAHVMTVVFGEVYDALLADMEVHSYGGVVRPHPELSLLLDAQGSVVSSRADLAVILLDTPVSIKHPATQLAGSEAKPGEFLVMAGYGYSTQVGQIQGLRYSRMNKVTSVPASPSGRILYEQQGPYVYDGFQGGPCFRETEKGRWLVGIASIGTSKELACTSTLSYQDWLRSELQHASEAIPIVP